MRADRLLSLVMLLRNRGRMSAAALAKELEVSTRTVLRDIDALSTSGFPVYAERGRHGGFELLPGFTTDLTGLTTDEATALLTGGASESLGMSSAFASAMRKVAASMSDEQRRAATTVAERVLVRPEGFLGGPTEPDPHLGLVQHAVFAGRRLSILYAPGRVSGRPEAGRNSSGRPEAGRVSGEPSRRTVDPLGLVFAGRSWYLLATHDGNERTYRLSRMVEVSETDEPAQRSSDIDLAAIWDRRRTDFRRSRETLTVTIRVRTIHRDDVVARALVVVAERPQGEWTEMDLELGGPEHAMKMVWPLAGDCEVVEPAALREQLRRSAVRVAEQHR